MYIKAPEFESKELPVPSFEDECWAATGRQGLGMTSFSEVCEVMAMGAVHVTEVFPRRLGWVLPPLLSQQGQGLPQLSPSVLCSLQ